MTMHTPPENQGQIVEVSYGFSTAGELYKRIHDRSDRSTQWYQASDEDKVNDYIESGSEIWNEEPPIADWIECAAPPSGDE